MNVANVLVLLGILTWAAFEYHRREQIHKETMAYLRNGVEPPTRSDTPRTLHLWTVGTTAILLLALSVGLLWYATSGSILYGYGSEALVILAIPFTGLAILLLLILRRDMKLRKHS
jgi:hypothetical protein